MFKISSSDVFDVDVVEKTPVFDHEALVYEKINDCYHRIFEKFPDNKPCENITNKDFNIVNSFTNEKSFESAVDVCMKLLAKYSQISYMPENNEEDNMTMDSQIIVECMNLLVDCKIPHHYKPGFLILLIRYCYFG